MQSNLVYLPFLQHASGDSCSNTFDLSSNVFGKDVANRELYIALGRYSGLERFAFVLVILLQKLSSTISIRLILPHLLHPFLPLLVVVLILSGTLLRQPYLLLAWQRAHRSGHNSHSLLV